MSQLISSPRVNAALLNHEIIDGVGGGSSNTVALTHVGNHSDSTPSDPEAWGTLAIGDEPSAGDSRFVLALDAGGSDDTWTSQTIGGAGATELASTSASGEGLIALSQLKVDSGTTASFSTDYSSAPSAFVGLAVMRVITQSGGLSVTSTDTDAAAGTGIGGNTLSLTITVAANGVGVFAVSGRNVNGWAWSGDASDTDKLFADYDMESNDIVSVITLAGPGTFTVTATPDAGPAAAVSVGVAVALDPA